MNGLTNDEREFLGRVAAAARRGLPQAEIAAEVGLPDAAMLHHRVRRLGHRLRATTRTELLETVSGRPFEDCCHV